jgi:hypothetical protein
MAARNAKKCSPGAIALVERVGGTDDVARIAPLTRPGISVHMHPVIALVTAGVEMDVLGIAYEAFPNAQRKAVVASLLPRRYSQTFSTGLRSYGAGGGGGAPSAPAATDGVARCPN